VALYDGKKMAQDYLLAAAQKAVVAALKAPQLTGKTKVKATIITGEDLEPVVEALGILGETSDFIRGDYVTIKRNIEKGTPPVAIVFGADCTQSATNWNCGACGFATCAEFNKYAKENAGMGADWVGPSCIWKTVDLGLAVDWAAAAVWHENLDNRVQDSVGAVAGLLGYLPGCNFTIGLSLGPPADLVWYNRPDVKHDFNQADIMQMLFRTIPEHFLGFVGDGNPAFKYNDNWLEMPKYQFQQVDEKLMELKANQLERLGAVVLKVEEKKQRAMAEKGNDE